jgi:4-cresol dehydrogenase (hydroxylating)
MQPENSDKVSSVTGISQDVAGKRAPQTVRDVIRLVRSARRQRQTLYPYSTGLNFGYGGTTPPQPAAVLVDLGALQSIVIQRSPDSGRVHPVAVIGPGVTQGMLHDYLEQHHPELTFNVTGSARATSIIGNALDRGVGYLGPRKDDVFGLVVVCGSGELLATGFRRLRKAPLRTSHPFGLGPMLDGLFFQSNFGIVLSACFRLVPKRPKQVALSLSLRRGKALGAFIDLLADFKREGLVDSVTHIANRERTKATLEYGVARYLEEQCHYTPARARDEADAAIATVAPGEWSSLAAVNGTRALVRVRLAEIRARIGHLARVSVITDTVLDIGYAITHRLRFLPQARANAAAIAAIRPLHKLALGVPTDAAIDNLLWKFGCADLPAAQLDSSNCGLIFINPALPLDGPFVERFIRTMATIAATHGHTLYITINIETATSLVAVINLLFDRNASAGSIRSADKAHDCAKDLLKAIHALGLEVYRARSDMMGALVARDPGYWNIVRRLKLALDPDAIIAPGRYDNNA